MKIDDYFDMTRFDDIHYNFSITIVFYQLQRTTDGTLFTIG